MWTSRCRSIPILELGFLLLSAGCVSKPVEETVEGGIYVAIEDRWSEAWAICQPPVPFVRSPRYPAELTRECEERLEVDLEVQWETFYDSDALEVLLEGAFHLLGRGAGVLSDLEEGEYIRADFIREMQAVSEALGTDELSAIYYNYVMFHIEQSVGWENPDTSWGSASIALDPETHTLLVSAWPGVDGLTYASFLVHEATHGLYDETPHVPCPGSGQLACDDDWGGSLGFQAAAATTWRPWLSREDDSYEDWEEIIAEIQENTADQILAD